MISPNLLPKMGIGTWGIAGYLHFDKTVDTEKQLEALKLAFDLGANYIDCSLKYADGESLKVIKDLITYAGRDNVFISAKLEKYIETNDDVCNQLEEYLRVLEIDSVDVLQLHVPSFTKIGIQETYREISKLIKAGKVRFAGASNFSVEQLKEAIAASGKYLVIHESLFNFSFRQNEDVGVLKLCREKGIKFVAYQPLHRGKTEAAENELLINLARNHGKSQSQIILNWLTRKGVMPLIRSDNPEHLKENLAAADFVMSEADYMAVDSFRDPVLNAVPVDWSDSGSGDAIYQIANKNN